MREESSPARLYALVVGAGPLFAGIVGFFYEAACAHVSQTATGTPGEMGRQCQLRCEGMCG